MVLTTPLLHPTTGYGRTRGVDEQTKGPAPVADTPAPTLCPCVTTNQILTAPAARAMFDGWALPCPPRPKTLSRDTALDFQTIQANPRELFKGDWPYQLLYVT
ncbi:unnamed protein product [Arctogadus glacialis]